MTAKDRLEIIRAMVGRVAGSNPVDRPKREGGVPTGRTFQLRPIEGLKPKSQNVHSEWLRVAAFAHADAKAHVGHDSNWD